MRRLYHEDVGPDGQVLVRRQRKANYPAAGGSLYERIEAEVAAQVAALGRFCTPEEERAIRLKERAKFRTVVPFYDYTFSPPKTVTVLWASLLQAAAEAEAAGNRSGGGAAGGAGRAGPRSGEAGQRPDDGRGGAGGRLRPHRAPFGDVGGVPGRRGVHHRQLPAARRPGRGRRSSTCTTRSPTGPAELDGADDKWRALHGDAAVPGTAQVRHAGGPVPGPGAGAPRLADRAPRGRQGARGRRDQRRGRRRFLYPVQGAAGTGPASSRTTTSATTVTLRAKRPGTRSSSRPLWRRGTARTTTRRRPGSSSPRGRAERSGAEPGSWPRSTKRPPPTQPSTRRASCRARRSGGASSARPSPRCRRPTPHGPAPS